MKQEEVNGLSVGDVVKHATGRTTFVVTGNYGHRATAIRTVDITNPVEWVLVAKANVEFVDKASEKLRHA